MQVYKCVISNDEMFSGIYPITETQNGMMLKVTGKLISRTEDIDPSLLGANDSAEGGEEGTEASTVSGVNIVMNHNLQQTTFDKKSYSLYIKKYLNDIKKKLMESDPDRVKDFMANAAECVKMITGNIKNWMFYTGESMDADGMVGLLDYSEDGVTPYMLFFKDGLEKIKY